MGATRACDVLVRGRCGFVLVGQRRREHGVAVCCVEVRLCAGQPDDVVRDVAGCAWRVLCVCWLAVASGAGLVLRVAAV